MARYTGPKHRLSRREGVNLTGTRSESLRRRLSRPPGAHGDRGVRRRSEYADQLRAKQRLKRRFGMTEKQFARTFEEAVRAKEPTGDALVKLLERRLDNVVYRLGFVPTMPMARQIVNHGHVLVNGRKVDIPSYRVGAGDAIELRERAVAIPVVESLAATAGSLPSWLSRDGDEAAGRVVNDPDPAEFDIPVELEKIIAFYAR